jgi:hypothetical protein
MYYYAHIRKKDFIIVTLFLLLLLAFAYGYLALVYWQPGYFAPCGLKTFFHLYCPGCGGTHAVYCLLHFQFVKSFLYNPLVIYAAAATAYYWLKSLICLIKSTGDAQMSVCLISIWGLLILLLLFTIIRNILLIHFGMDYMGELVQYWH